ncbi:MAG: RpiB/LacA/LacB family sugar-phosphate isomerase [Lachnospiraceae bacterium]|nr:RpiB/LacA/LacB family sugar-phosphate isomerase [Lachnospiraceae bacterium]
MKIGIIQAASQKDKNELLYACTKKAVAEYGHEVINFGLFSDETEIYSYVEIAICISLLLSGKAVDFIVTGCSSGQGMMLACNSLPGVFCGYTPTPQDAYLFGRINGGNAVSLPLGLNFGWAGEINLQCTLDKLFDGEFGVGYPAKDADRKRMDTKLLKAMNTCVKRNWQDIIVEVDTDIVRHILQKHNVIKYIMENGTDDEIKALLNKKIKEVKIHGRCE